MRSRSTLTTFVLLLVAAVLPALCAAQSTYPQKRATLAYAWDLDGEAADPDQIVTAANGDLTDTKTFTITAQPDVCRLVDVTQTDANSSITAGLLTITGTDCLGYARSCALDYSVAANRGSGVKSPSVTTGPSGSSCYLGAVTTITTNALTGEGGAGVDLVTIGYTSNSVNGWGMYGTLLPVGPNAEHGVDPFVSTTGPGTLVTSGASTTVTNTSGVGFASVAVGDLLLFEVQGKSYERKVTAKASDSSVTVNAAVTISPTTPWEYRKFYYSTDPTDQMAVPVRGYSTAFVDWSVLANANTGGLVLSVQGAGINPGWPSTTWLTMCPTAGVDCLGITNSVASGATKTWGEAVDLTLLPMNYLRVGWAFGSGDDADVAPESITMSVTLK